MENFFVALKQKNYNVNMKISLPWLVRTGTMAVIAGFILAPKIAAAATYYVSASGNDSNPGSQSAPLRHLSVAVADAANPGDSVVVMDGSYDNEGQVAPAYVVTLTHSGTAANPIVIMAQHRGQATLDAGNTSTTATCNGASAYFDLANAAYVTIQGFNIQNGCYQEIHSNNSAHNITIKWNELHNTINHSITQSSNAQSGIYLNANNSNFIFDGNIFHDIGNTNDIGNSYSQLIYAHGPNTTIINNIFYNALSGWDIQTSNSFSGLIANNTFVGPNLYHGGASKAGQIILWDGDVANSLTNIIIRNNLFINPYQEPIVTYSGVGTTNISGCAIDHNLTTTAVIYDNGFSCSIGSNLVSTNPALINSTTQPYNLQETATSPGINAGINISQVTEDFNGTSRPQGASYDIGAYQLITAATAPSINLSPSSLTFNSVVVGATSTAQFINITNNGNVTLTFSSIIFNGNFSPAGLGSCGVSVPLAAGTSCTISVNFVPTALGSRSGGVTLTDNASNSPQTVTFSGIGISAPDIIPPSIPVGLTATASSPSQINLSWTASSDNVGVSGYHIYRSSALIATTTTTFYQDVGLNPNTSYSYSVSAFDVAGNQSAQSIAVNATTQNIVVTATSTPVSSTTTPSINNNPPSSGGGGSGGGSYQPPSTNPSGGGRSIINNAPPSTAPTSSSGIPNATSPSSTIRLINNSGTFYLIINNQLRGITNPGILASYGLTFTQAQPAQAEDLVLPQSSPLPPGDGSLVKSSEDNTVYLISGQQRYGFISAQAFLNLGFSFNNVLIVTNPELQILPQAGDLSGTAVAHLPGININDHGTIYWIGSDGQRHAYTSLSIYNSWNVPNDFSQVVPANTADLQLPIGQPISTRVLE